MTPHTPFLLSAQRRRAAFTLAEVLIAAAVTSVLAAGLLITATVVQRNFRACENHVQSQADQLRLLDYIALDLRRALTVTASTDSLAMTIPDFYEYDENGESKPRDPVIKNGKVYYGEPDAPDIQIRYYMQDGTIYRNLGGEITELATSVSDFEIAFEEAEQVVKVSISFLPEFRLWGNRDSARSSTTTYTSTLLRNTRRDI